jgi:hypothetical protein
LKKPDFCGLQTVHPHLPGCVSSITRLLNYPITQSLLIRVYSRNSRLLSLSAFIKVNLRQTSLPFPDERIKAAAGLKAQSAVEFHGLGIGFRHGKAQAKEAAAAQLLRA